MEKRVITITIIDPARDAITKEHLRGPIVRRYLTQKDVVDDAPGLKSEFSLSVDATVQLEDGAPVAIENWKPSIAPPVLQVDAQASASVPPASEKKSEPEDASDSVNGSQGGE